MIIKTLAEKFAADPALDATLAGSDPFLQKLMRYFLINAGRRLPAIARSDIASTALDANGEPICYRPAAVLIPIIRPLPGAESTVVFTVRTDTLSTHAGQVSFPGGRTDPDDFDPVHTALRESEEEIGLTRESVRVVGQLGQILLPSGYCVTPIVGLIESNARFRPSPREVAGIFSAPSSLVLNPASYQRKLMKWQNVERPVLELEFERYRIWGATAAILHHLGSELARLD